MTAEHRRHAARGVAYTAAGASFFALNASISKAVLESGVDPQLLTILRSFGAMTGLAVLVALVDRRRFRLRPREIPQLILYGVVGIALVQWLYFVAIDRLSVSLALLIEFTAPVLVALWARFAMGENVRGRVWAALALAVSGLALVAEVWDGSRDVDTVGVLAAAASAASLAAYWLIGERAVTTGEARDPVSVSFWGFVFASIAWLPMVPTRVDGLDALASDTSLLGAFEAVAVPVWLLVLAVVVAGTIVPFGLQVAAMRHITATQVGLIATLEPVLATMVAWLWLEQALSGWQAAGVGVVITGLLLAQTARRAPVPTSPDPDPRTPARTG